MKRLIHWWRMRRADVPWFISKKYPPKHVFRRAERLTRERGWKNIVP